MFKGNVVKLAVVGILLMLLVVFAFKDYKRVSTFKESWKSEGAYNRFQSPKKVTKDLNKIIHNVKISSITNQDMYTKENVNAPAVLFKPKGGTGNQLFLYACHYALARKHNWPLYTLVPKSHTIYNRTFVSKKREFSLDQFNIPLFQWNTITTNEGNISNIERINDSQILSGEYSKNKVITLLGSDYCQSETFFLPYKQEILEMFRLKIVPRDDTIDLDPFVESVAVHIRLGDFVRLGISVPLTFYKEAMRKFADKFGSRVKFYVFSDDIYLVQKMLFSKQDIFPTDFQVNFMTTKKTSLEELYLISKCKHQIIPNSSFGWWAAYLNENLYKIVVAAHHDVNFFGRIYRNRIPQEFFKFEFRHIYYPINWVSVDVFSANGFNKNYFI